MLTPDEIEAAMLGAQWVRDHGDPQLVRAASDLVAKIGAVIPEHLRPILMEPSLAAFTMRKQHPDAIDMARVRAAIRTQGKLVLLYADEHGQETRRTVWPIAVSYWDSVRIIVAWCEMRRAFRHFRTDRVLDSEFLEIRYPTPRARLRAAWMKEVSDCRDETRRRMDSPRRLEALVE
jgi:predicted DNA-binding transcriptional regulator YafY